MRSIDSTFLNTTKCPSCGAENEENIPYCTKCGAPLMNGRIPCDLRADELPPELKPIGAWAYFGYSLLMMIPIVGLVLLFVFSFGKKRNINLKNFARSHFCYIILYAIAFIVFAAVGGLTALGNMISSIGV